MFLLFTLLLAVACLVALLSDRYGLSALMFIGFIQDPFRKVIEGEPIILIVTVAAVFAILVFKQLNQVGFSGISQPFVSWVAYLRKPLTLFLVILIVQFIHSLLRWGSPIVSTIGLVSYIAPFVAIVVGYYSVNYLSEVRQFLKIYSAVGVLVAITVALSFVGFELTIFREVGAGLKIYDQGTILRSFSGFMRTGEIAAWHIASAACFLIILYSTSERKYSMLLVSIIVLFLMLAIAFTGRRKMLMLISMFVALYLFGTFYFRKTLSTTKLILGLGFIIMIWLGVQFIFPISYSDEVQNYLARGSSVYGDASNRFFELGLKPIQWAYNRVGLLGGGLGIGSQGASVFQSSSIAGGSGEGGLGKIMVELGLPGLLSIIWLMIAFSRYMLRCLQLTTQAFAKPSLMLLSLGLTIFLLVNVMTFSVASQVYGDMFILIVVGLCSGFLFALPKLVINDMPYQTQATPIT